MGYIIGSLLVSLTNSLPLILLGRIITGDFNAVGTNALLQTQIWIWNLESGIWIQNQIHNHDQEQFYKF